MRVVADCAIPFLRGVLEPFADVVYLPGDAFAPEAVRGADALLIRTRTRCDAALLEGSGVRMIATATIGFDHIDLEYCRKRGIRVAASAGCNARGVLQWVAAVLALFAAREGWTPASRTLGIVGVGHVGSLVKRYAESWGFRVLCCDPPREAREHAGFLPLEEVASRSDLLTFHTPLDASTRHMADASLLALVPRGGIVINASRGAVVDGAALRASGLRYALDVWEGEPSIDAGLLAGAAVATPHVAGYSAQGKANATAQAVRALADFFALPLGDWYPYDAVTPVEPRPIGWSEMCATIGRYCDPERETAVLKADARRFEALRNGYRYRQEYF